MVPAQTPSYAQQRRWKTGAPVASAEGKAAASAAAKRFRLDLKMNAAGSESTGAGVGGSASVDGSAGGLRESDSDVSDTE